MGNPEKPLDPKIVDQVNQVVRSLKQELTTIIRNKDMKDLAREVVSEIASAIDAESDQRTQLLIEKMAPELGGRDAIALWGFLSKLDNKNQLRLYLNIEFTEYIEFSKTDYIYHIPLATSFNPLAGTMVWIQRDARVHYTNRESTPLEARFRQGDMSQGVIQNNPVWPTGPGQIRNMPGSGGGCSNIPNSCWNGPRPVAPGSGGGCSGIPNSCPG